MKKFLQSLVVLAGVLVITGCSAPAKETTTISSTVESSVVTSSEKAQTLKVSIVLSEDGKEFSNAELEVKEGSTVMEALQEKYDVVEDKGFITTIDGKEQNVDGNNKWWMYTVNGEMANVGAAEYKLKDGDKVEFDLSKYEG